MSIFIENLPPFSPMQLVTDKTVLSRRCIFKKKKKISKIGENRAEELTKCFSSKKSIVRKVQTMLDFKTLFSF